MVFNGLRNHFDIGVSVLLFLITSRNDNGAVYHDMLTPLHDLHLISSKGSYHSFSDCRIHQASSGNLTIECGLLRDAVTYRTVHNSLHLVFCLFNRPLATSNIGNVLHIYKDLSRGSSSYCHDRFNPAGCSLHSIDDDDPVDYHISFTMEIRTQ